MFLSDINKLSNFIIFADILDNIEPYDHDSSHFKEESQAIRGDHYLYFKLSLNI